MHLEAPSLPPCRPNSLCHLSLRYTDEVRKVIKSCYDEVWAALESRRDGLSAGIKALSERKEMLGEELVSLLLG